MKKTNGSASLLSVNLVREQSVNKCRFFQRSRVSVSHLFRWKLTPNQARGRRRAPNSPRGVADTLSVGQTCGSTVQRLIRPVKLERKSPMTRAESSGLEGACPPHELPFVFVPKIPA
jgi:hypothetical protein